MIIRIALNRFFPPLKKYEEKILFSVAAKLDAKTQDLFLKQIEQINYVRREFKNKDACFHNIRNGKSFNDYKLRLPTNYPEMKLASVTFKVKSTENIFRANIYMFNGFVFSIEFNKSPSKLNPDDMEISDIYLFKIDWDYQDQKNEPPNIDDMKGPYAEWLKKMKFGNFKKPLPEDMRDEITSHLYAKLPTDYYEMMCLTEGAESEDAVLFGFSEIRSLPFSEGNCHGIAEIKNYGMFVVNEDNTEPTIYFWHYEDLVPIEEGNSICKAIEKMAQYRPRYE